MSLRFFLWLKFNLFINRVFSQKINSEILTIDSFNSKNYLESKRFFFSSASDVKDYLNETFSGNFSMLLQFIFHTQNISILFIFEYPTLKISKIAIFQNAKKNLIQKMINDNSFYQFQFTVSSYSKLDKIRKNVF